MGHWLGLAAGFLLLGGLAVVLLYWLYGIGWVAVNFYREARYGRHGICPVCKLPYVTESQRPADQMYGPDRVTDRVCPNGHVGIPQGNRRFAEW